MLNDKKLSQKNINGGINGGKYLFGDILAGRQLLSSQISVAGDAGRKYFPWDSIGSPALEVSF